VTVALTPPVSVSEDMVNFIMVKVPLAVGTWAVPWYDMPSRVAEPATMTDAAVDASTPGVPAAVLDLDWLPAVDPADTLGCGVLPGLDEDPGVAPVPASAEDGWVAAGVGLGLGAWLGVGEGKHRIPRMQLCCGGGVASCAAFWPTRVVPASSSGRTAAAITRPPCRGGSSGRRVGWSADGVQAKPIEPPMMPSSMPMKKPPKFEAMNDSTASSTPAIA
jgi:hypothetical protein